MKWEKIRTKTINGNGRLTKPLRGSKEEIRLNKEFQKKLNELSKLSGYEKPKKISGSLKLDSNENFVIGKKFQLGLINAAKRRCDPLNCRKKVYDFQQIKDYKIIGPEDCKENKNCIQDALDKTDNLKLKEGNYKIYSSIVVYNKVLTGENGNVNINAEGAGGRAIMVNEGIVANINVNFAKDIAFDIKFNSPVYRSVADRKSVV